MSICATVTEVHVILMILMILWVCIVKNIVGYIVTDAVTRYELQAFSLISIYVSWVGQKVSLCIVAIISYSV